jgi:hypothetical protein
MDERIYQIRRQLLRALKEYNPTPCEVADMKDYPGFTLLNPEADELKREWKNLADHGYTRRLPGFDNKYCRITSKGLEQLSGEFVKDPFVWGPRAL